MTERLRYSMVVQWSDDDRAYLVTLPEWEGRVFNPIAHGDSYEDAIEQGHQALAALVASTRQRNEPLPEPRVSAATRESGLAAQDPLDADRPTGWHARSTVLDG